MLEQMIPSINASQVTDIQLLTMRMQMLEAAKIYPFKENFERNFEKVFDHPAPSKEEYFWNLYWAMTRDYPLMRFLALVVPNAVANAPEVCKQIKAYGIDEIKAIRQIIILQQQKNFETGVQTKTNQSTQPYSSKTATAIDNFAVFHIPLIGHTSFVAKSINHVLVDLRKLYPDEMAFLNAAYTYYSPHKSGDFGRKKAELSNLWEKMSSVDPLQFADYFLTDINSNDIAVECSIFLKTIVASIGYDNANERVILVLPTPQLIYHWCHHPLLNSVNVVFVLQNSTMCKLLRLSKFIEGKPIVIHEYEDTQRTSWRSHKFPPATVLAIRMPEEKVSPMSIAKAVAPFSTKRLLKPQCRIIGFYGRSPGKPEPAVLSQHADELKKLCLQSIQYLPQEIALSTSPRLKIIFQATYSTYMEQTKPIVDIVKYAHNIRNRRAYLKFEPHKCFSTAVSFELLSMTHKQLHALKRQLSQMVIERNHAESFFGFGPTIPVWFSKQKLSGGKIRYNFYVRLPAKVDSKTPHSLSKGNVIVLTKQSLTYNPKIKEDEFILKYLFGAGRSSTKATIRELVGKAFDCLEKPPVTITLREFWYLNPSLDKSSEKNFANAIYKYMLSRHTNLPINTLKAEDIELSIQNFFSDRSLSFLESVANYMGNLFDLAASKKYIDDYIFIELDEKGLKRRRNVFREIRESLRNRFLTIEQMQSIIDMFEKDKNNTLLLGAVIQIHTGIPVEELCAARWHALEYNEELGHYSLLIDEQVLIDGHHTAQQLSERKLTLPCELGILLSSRREELMQTIPLATLDEMNIISDCAGKNISPREYKAFIHKLLRPFFPVDMNFWLPLVADKTKHINLTGDNIDLLRHNYEHHAKRIMMLTNGESCSVLGKKPKYIMDINYIDHASPISHHIVCTKSRRLNVRLLSSNLSLTPSLKFDKGRKFKLSGTCSDPRAKRSIINLRIPAGMSLKIVANNQHGMNIDSAVFLTEELLNDEGGIKE
jgi:hypothetical protein